MPIVSLEFLLFVLVAQFLYFVIFKKFQPHVLIVMSLFYVFFTSKWSALFIILSVFSIYLGGILMEEKKKAKNLKILWLVIFFNVFLLVFLKYFNKSLPKNILIPIGISYYTLEAISYIVDVYRKPKTKETNFFNLLLFLTFFPKMTLGPIGKYSKLQEDLTTTNKPFDYLIFRKGFLLVLIGYFKKLVIADRLGLYVDFIYSHDIDGYSFIIASIFYVFQLLMEFSGCIDIVRGVSLGFQINLSENFKQPLFARNIQDFWRRWHITLGAWLKEYIFYPISLSKTNMKLNKIAKTHLPKHLSKFLISAFPLFFVWIINGAWHGVGGKYLIYGMYYYVLMMIGLLFEPLNKKILSVLGFEKESEFLRIFQTLRTFVLLVIGFAIFRADSLGYVINHMTSFESPLKIHNASFSRKDLILVIILLIKMKKISAQKEAGTDVIQKIEEEHLIYRWIVYYALIFSILIFGIYGEGYSTKDFIYGGF